MSDEVMARARRAADEGVTRLCMGAAWRDAPEGPEFDTVLRMVRGVAGLGLEVCCTLGMLTDDQARRLKEAGLAAYNHNLDTSPEFYGHIITTRVYDERLRTLAAVRRAGITVCCGGIIGMGESDADRLGLLQQLARQRPHPESVPINLLQRVAGTPLAGEAPLDPLVLVRMLATARILMPAAMVRLAAGRDQLSREAEVLCFMAGANSIFVGDTLLTTSNPAPDTDRQLLGELGLTPMLAPDAAERVDRRPATHGGRSRVARERERPVSRGCSTDASGPPAIVVESREWRAHIVPRSPRGSSRSAGASTRAAGCSAPAATSASSRRGNRCASPSPPARSTKAGFVRRTSCCATIAACPIRRRATAGRRAAAAGASPGKPSAETLLHLEIARRRQAGAVLHTHSVWTTVLSDLHGHAGGFSIEGYEMLKGLAGVSSHEHREWIPIVDNDQDMPRLAQRVGAMLEQQPRRPRLSAAPARPLHLGRYARRRRAARRDSRVPVRNRRAQFTIGEQESGNRKPVNKHSVFIAELAGSRHQIFRGVGRTRRLAGFFTGRQFSTV